MVTLTDIKPNSITSVLQRNWRADAPPWIAIGLVALPPLFLLSSPLRFLFLGLGVAAGVATEIALSRLRQRWRIQEAMTPPLDPPEPAAFDPVRRAEEWQELTADPGVRSLVLFSYGTCVVIVEESGDPTELAKLLLSQYGHAVPGTPSADMLVYALPESGDFVIGCHHPNILTHVPRSLADTGTANGRIGIRAAYLGRDFRRLDTFVRQVVHVKRVGSQHSLGAGG